MRLPEPRGPVSELVVAALRGAPGTLAEGPVTWYGSDPVRDEDLQLLLFICYRLHYHGWDEVDDRWEWDPKLLALRAVAEERFT